MEFKNDKVKMMMDQVEVPDSLAGFAEALPQRYRNGEFAADRIEQVNQGWEQFQMDSKPKWTPRKKALVSMAAVAASLLLFVGSGFVSPAMAKVIGKIPPLSSWFEKHEENVSDIIKEKLAKEGYPVKEVIEVVGIGIGGVHVFLDASDDKVQEMKKGVEKAAFGILHGDPYKGTKTEDYFVKVYRYKEPSEEYKQKQEEIEKETDQIFAIVEPVLRAQGYDFRRGFGGGVDTVELEFANTESKEKIDQIEKAVKEALTAAGKDSVTIKHRIFNLEREEQYARWSEAVSAIAQEFMTYKKYEVRGVGYKSRDGLMSIIVTMTLPSSDPKAKEKAADLVTMMEEFIHTEKIWQQVKDDRYEIVIRSKDKVQLNK
ncbi:DUF4030 domain-containing protein [Neobacillus muris]|uniref:DUF4030 domain-containing protein n=1 Tax=Neobacillus muris TaxID=2941334 RepID=UPI00203E69BF|nr:DUF4030 domain-containing protein [Neobacillus muris]